MIRTLIAMVAVYYLIAYGLLPQPNEKVLPCAQSYSQSSLCGVVASVTSHLES